METVGLPSSGNQGLPEDLGDGHELLLEDGGDLVPLGHDVHHLGPVRPQGGGQMAQPGLGHHQGLVGQDAEPGRGKGVDLGDLGVVLSGQDGQVALFLGDHPLQVVRAGVDVEPPGRGILAPGVVGFDDALEGVKLGPAVGIDVHLVRQAGVALAEGQGRVKVAGVADGQGMHGCFLVLVPRGPGEA